MARLRCMYGRIDPGANEFMLRCYEKRNAHIHCTDLQTTHYYMHATRPGHAPRTHTIEHYKFKGAIEHLVLFLADIHFHFNYCVVLH